MKRKYLVLISGCVAALIMFQPAGFASAPVLAITEVRAAAVARLQDVNGVAAGTVSFTQVNANVIVVAHVVGLPPGFHGFHIHAVGLCDPTGETPFASAGPHHNPGGHQHADHAGDLPSLLVLETGAGDLTAVTDRFSVAELLDSDGSAVIIHANADNFANIPERYGVPDEQTLATGDSGGRIACGVVQPAAEADSEK